MNSQEQEVCNKVGLTKSILETHSIGPSIVNFDADSVLFKPGDSCRSFLILCTGSIRVEMTAKSGRELTLYRVKSLESCISTTTALLNGEDYYVQGIAESEITAVALSVSDFYKAIQYSNQFTRYVLAGYASRISSVVRLIDRKAGRDVMLDVSHHLITNVDPQMTITATQTEIANDIGTAREVVGRKLHTLESEGVVELQRGAVVVRDIARLKEIAQM